MRTRSASVHRATPSTRTAIAYLVQVTWDSSSTAKADVFATVREDSFWTLCSDDASAHPDKNWTKEEFASTVSYIFVSA